LVAERDTREAAEAVQRAIHAAKEAGTIEQLITLRKAQEARLGGVMGLGRPFGHAGFSASRDREFILDAMRYARGAIKSSVKRAAVAEAIRARTEQAKGEVSRWAKENEVATFGARTINYHGPDGQSWTGVCLLRSIQHRAGVLGGFTIDPFATLLQIPLPPEDVSPLVVSATNAQPPLATYTVMVDSKGTFELSPSPFQAGE
jgi:hypothetical protein